MKKTLLIIGGIVAVTAIVAGVLIVLKKIRMSFTIASNDEFELEDDNDDIFLSIEDEEE